MGLAARARGRPAAGHRLPGGLILWVPCGDDVVGAGYRVHGTGPSRWELTHRGTLLSVHRRLSSAQAAAGIHHRASVRRRDLLGWGSAAIAGIAAAAGFCGVGGVGGFAGVVGSAWLAVTALPRAVAAATGSLLDPYRRRDPWETRDWWNH